MFVKYTPKHAHIKVVPIVNNDGLSVTAESIILNPGTNEVSEDKWEKIKPSLSAEIAEGTIKPFTVETKKAGVKAKAKTLKDVPAATAAMIVNACSNKDTLRSWFKDNLPDEIALLVVKRMRVLNMDIDEISGESNELSDADICDESNSGDAGNGDSEKTSEKGDSDFDSMSYNELKAAAKAKGINPSQSKEALLSALKGDENNESGSEDDSGDAGNGDGDIPDFDNPAVQVK